MASTSTRALETGEHPERVNYIPRLYAYVRDGVIKIVNTDNNWDRVTALEAEGLIHDLKICLKAARSTSSPSIRRKEAGLFDSAGK